VQEVTTLRTKNNVSVKRSISYRAVNTIRLGYTNQSVNAVQDNSSCSLCDLYTTHKFTLRAECRISLVLMVGHL
jgi:hypothetical protein